MGHSLLFYRYVKGKPAPYDVAKLRSILSKHGAEIAKPRDSGRGVSRYLVGFPVRADGDCISRDASYIYVDSAGVIEFSIGRPTYGASLKQLSFDLLQSLEICMHPDFGREVYTVSLYARHIPEGLLKTCQDGLTVVREPDDLWRQHRREPTPADLALEELRKKPHYFYADGSPVQVGDAVLIDNGQTPATVGEFWYATGGDGMPFPAGVIVNLRTGGMRFLDNSLAKELQFVARGVAQP
jgi:hypothetical protein